MIGQLGREALVDFEDTRTPTGYVTRYLTLHDRRAFEIGNGCDTSAFWFTRRGGANTNGLVRKVSETLRAGLTDVRSPAAEAFSRVLPDDTYRSVLLHVEPELVHPLSDTRTSRSARDCSSSSFRCIHRHGWATRRSLTTGLASPAHRHPPPSRATVLDIKQPAVWYGEPDITTHWCLAHYLLDGHHKLYAAQPTNRNAVLGLQVRRRRIRRP